MILPRYWIQTKLKKQILGISYHSYKLTSILDKSEVPLAPPEKKPYNKKESHLEDI